MLMSLWLASEHEPFIMHVILMNAFCQESRKPGERAQNKFRLMETKRLILGRMRLSCVSHRYFIIQKKKKPSDAWQHHLEVQKHLPSELRDNDNDLPKIALPYELNNTVMLLTHEARLHEKYISLM